MKNRPFVVEIVPYHRDNYAYLLHCPQSRSTALFDCGDAAPVLERLRKRNWDLTHIFATHYHSDHTLGISELLARYPNSRFFKPAGESRLDHTSRELKDGDRIPLGDRSVRAIGVPAHTRSCTSYLIEDCLFVGDALFSAGCGRLFEGSAGDLMAAMDRFDSLPDDTKVYPGHEYTESNLKFALFVEKESREIREYLDTVADKRARGEFTVPTTIGREKRINPFLRIDRESVWRRVDSGGEMDRIRRIAALRRLKDGF